MLRLELSSVLSKRKCYLATSVKELVPGLGTSFVFFIPYQRSNKVELQYSNDFAGITAGINLTVPPITNFSAVIGRNFLCIGTDLSFDSATRTFAKCNAGFSFNSPVLDASMTLNDKCDNLKASFYRSVNPLTTSAIAAELSHKFFSNETTLAFGAQHALFPVTVLKARVDTRGNVGALLQQELFQTFFCTMAGELDVKAGRTSAKVGMSLALRP
ncbi:hypothetical protein RJ639_032543 [Escallonia herrerae]|uniref:Uncharacterized protein n=1 Tax=Escallonia herrerae TaxID=1293975 RepID=A0AA89BL39_9ASTE|nr:hypothetical protein RJ639_032543 [Escallonia herrerae]